MKESKIRQYNEALRSSGELVAVRRSAHAVTEEAWIKDLLRRGAYGVLATECNGQPFLNANNYVYDEAGDCLYLHRSPAGRTSANLEANPRVCYTVVEMGRMIPAPDAFNFGVEYRSVVIFGTAAPVEAEEAYRALQMLMEKYAPHLQAGVNYRPVSPECVQKAAVYKITIEVWSGKQREYPPDQPGAYTYDS
jgi:nitroimidazol reductase NimA-like FMN-containing flavoprotein (pyridoxamine 5'-phosphate oxidase superfamily)